MTMQKPNRTPFIQQQVTGEWVLLLPAGMQVEWGQRFDKEIGYRVFVKFVDCTVANVMPPRTAAIWSRQFAKNENRPEILVVCKALKDMADICDRLNTAWAAAGAPDEPLDKIGVAGNG